MPDIWIPWFDGYGGYEGLGIEGLEEMIKKPVNDGFHSPLSSISNHNNSIKLIKQ